MKENIILCLFLITTLIIYINGYRDLSKRYKRSKILAFFIALLFGWAGFHRAYLGGKHTKYGFVYLFFCLGIIPSLIAIIEGIKYLTMSDECFDKKFNYKYKLSTREQKELELKRQKEINFKRQWEIRQQKIKEQKELERQRQLEREKRRALIEKKCFEREQERKRLKEKKRQDEIAKEKKIKYEKISEIIIELQKYIKENPKKRSCYVYLMQDEVNNFYKIGISNNPQVRERTLQSEKPTIVLIAKKEYPSREIAYSIEQALHKTFYEKHLRGEWFKLTKQDLCDVNRTLND